MEEPTLRDVARAWQCVKESNQNLLNGSNSFETHWTLYKEYRDLADRYEALHPGEKVLWSKVFSESGIFPVS